jgi:hypothetical protein
MSQENVDTLLRSFCRPSSRRLVARAIVGLACVSVVALTAIPAYGAFPGRNGRIAYVDPGLGISSVWPNGMGRQRLVREGRDPAYSPRGDRIAFTRFFEIRVDDPGVTRFELSRIELIGAAGRGRSVLTGGDDYSPAWAPGGKRISFSRTNPCDKYYDVEANCPPRVQMDREYGALIHRLGGHTRVWRRDGAVPVWSPDGKLISYVRTALYASRPDGSNPRQLVRRRSVSGGYDWSPDGSRVVFSYEKQEWFSPRTGSSRRDRPAPPRPKRRGAVLLARRALDCVRPNQRASRALIPALRRPLRRDAVDHARQRRTWATTPLPLRTSDLRIRAGLAATPRDHSRERAGPRSHVAAGVGGVASVSPVETVASQSARRCCLCLHAALPVSTAKPTGLWLVRCHEREGATRWRPLLCLQMSDAGRHPGYSVRVPVQENDTAPGIPETV